MVGAWAGRDEGTDTTKHTQTETDDEGQGWFPTQACERQISNKVTDVRWSVGIRAWNSRKSLQQSPPWQKVKDKHTLNDLRALNELSEAPDTELAN